jgi:hypothetical protein
MSVGTGVNDGASDTASDGLGAVVADASGEELESGVAMATLGWIRAAGDDVGPDEALQAPSAADNDASKIRDRVRLDGIAVIGRVLS